VSTVPGEGQAATSLLCSRSSGEDVIVRLLGALHSSCLPVKLHRAGDGAVDDG